MRSRYYKLIHQAQKLEKNGNLEEAKLIYEKVFQAEPENIENTLNIASIYHRLNDNVNELKYLSDVALRTNNIKQLFACANLAEKTGNIELAIGYLNKILEFDSENLNAMTKIAMLYRNIDKKLACDMFIELFENNKSNNDFLYMILLCSTEVLDFNSCIKYGLEYVSRVKNDYNAYYMIANAYEELYDYTNAEKYSKIAYDLNPNKDNKLQYAKICEKNNHEDIAFDIAKNMLDTKSGRKIYKEILLRNKNHKGAGLFYFNENTELAEDSATENKAREMYYKLNVKDRFNISEDTFAQFRLNLDVDFHKKEEILHSKLLRKEDFTNKKILMYSPNGIGDLLMGVRYVNIMLEKTSNISMVVPKSVIELLKFNYPNLKITDIKEDFSIDEYDYTATFLGLLYNLDVDLSNIPFSKGYLNISEEKVREKSELDFIKNTDKKKIGIFWQGNAGILQNRSIKPEKLLPIFNDNRQIYSFQISKTDNESYELLKTLPVVDLRPNIKNYADTAAFLKNMNVLITIDSSIAHLAGALGIKTYLLLPYYTEWRWFYDTQTTPWYDSVRLFKQTKPNDWDEVITRVNRAITDEFDV